MTMSALVAIADGSEEMEAIIAIDVLRRAGIEVTLASVKRDSRTIKASRGVIIVADATIDEASGRQFDVIVLPGGMPGAANLSESAVLQAMLQQQAAKRGWIAAICAAPAVVLQRHGLLADEERIFNATCHPAFQAQLDPGHCHPSQRVVVDGNIVTSQAPGTSFEFALTLVELLCGKEKRKEVAGPMLV
jgi:4-methyl-5(b-hydroxyethyl)-thiazole monophosphate biosynthesis